MIKKLLFLLLILSTLSTYNNSFANENSDFEVKSKLDTAKTKYESAIQQLNDAEKYNDNNINTNPGQFDGETRLNTAKEELNTASAEYSQATSEYKQTEAYKNSPEGKQDISSRGFEVEVGTVTPGKNLGISSGTKTTEVLNMTLGNIIQKLMIGLGSVSLLIMTAGGGYMVVYHGQDELLSKGKSMFTSGIIALIVSLSSYYIVDLLRFILYS